MLQLFTTIYGDEVTSFVDKVLLGILDCGITRIDFSSIHGCQKKYYEQFEVFEYGIPIPLFRPEIIYHKFTRDEINDLNGEYAFLEPNAFNAWRLDVHDTLSDQQYRCGLQKFRLIDVIHYYTTTTDLETRKMAHHMSRHESDDMN